MAGISDLLNIAKSALFAQQSAMNVVNHNIANADTEGYSKQEIQFRNIGAIANMRDQIGRGVDSSGVRQRQAGFANQRIRQESTSLGKWSASRRILEQVETLFTGAGESDLNAAINNFFNAWEDLSGNPESIEFRGQLLQKAQALTGKFHELNNSMGEIKDNLNVEINGTVNQANNLLRQVEGLNNTIEATELRGQRANDLRDQRGVLLRQLSGIMDIEVHEQPGGAVQVSHNGLLLLDRGTRLPLEAKTSAKNGELYTEISIDGKATTFDKGELGGLLNVRNELIPSYQDDINTIAKGVVEHVNAHHENGFGSDGSTGTSFFNPNGINAGNIELNQDVLDSPEKIAAAGGTHDYINDIHQSNGVGDNSIARKIAQLRDVTLLNKNSATFQDVYSNLYANVGFDTGEAKQNEESHQLLVNQLDNYRESLVGVSIDEEMADLMKFQNNYAAAAKLITVANDSMKTLLSIVG